MGEGSLYLQLVRFVEGEQSLLSDISRGLSRHLFTLPVFDREEEGANDLPVTFHSYAFEWCGKLVVPIFLSNKSFRAWEEKLGEQLSCIEVFGADLFFTIPAEYGVILEPYSSIEMVLSDEFLERLEEEDSLSPSLTGQIASLPASSSEDEGWYRPAPGAEMTAIEVASKIPDAPLAHLLHEKSADAQNVSDGRPKAMIRRSTTILQPSQRKSSLFDPEGLSKKGLVNDEPPKGEKRSFLKFLKNAK